MVPIRFSLTEKWQVFMHPAYQLHQSRFERQLSILLHPVRWVHHCSSLHQYPGLPNAKNIIYKPAQRVFGSFLSLHPKAGLHVSCSCSQANLAAVSPECCWFLTLVWLLSSQFSSSLLASFSFWGQSNIISLVDNSKSMKPFFFFCSSLRGVLSDSTTSISFLSKILRSQPSRPRSELSLLTTKYAFHCSGVKVFTKIDFVLMNINVLPKTRTFFSLDFRPSIHFQGVRLPVQVFFPASLDIACCITASAHKSFRFVSDAINIVRATSRSVQFNLSVFPLHSEE